MENKMIRDGTTRSLMAPLNVDLKPIDIYENIDGVNKALKIIDSLLDDDDIRAIFASCKEGKS